MRAYFKKLFIVIFCNLLTISAYSQGTWQVSRLSQQDWVDSVFKSMDLDRKLGQLFMVAAYSNKDSAHIREIQKLIVEHHLGGVIFMQGGPMRQARLNNYYQSISKVPLLVSIDGEWGLAMRLDSTIAFPKQMTMGALRDNKYIYEMGVEVGRQCKRLGIHVNFAPSVDINSNPANPVIGFRSFGEEKKNVSNKASSYMRGMQSQHMLGCAKHFPGHGDTGTDSHHSLPVVNHSRRRMDTMELYPFKKLIKDSVAGVMVAHMKVPAYDTVRNRATTLAPEVVTGLLKNELGFTGLVFTDALNMRGVTQYYKPGEVDLLALQAGNDVLLFSEDVPTATLEIKKAFAEGRLDSNNVFASVKKILAWKYWAGLNQYKPVELINLTEDLNNAKAKTIRQTLYEQSLTLVRNKQKVLPILALDSIQYGSVALNMPKDNAFQSTLTRYACFDNYALNFNNSTASYDSAIAKLSACKLVVIALGGYSAKPVNNYGMSDNAFRLISALHQRTKIVLVLFGTPYAIKYFEDIQTIIAAYEDNYTTNRAAAIALFGGAKFEGKLPVSVSKRICEGTGENTVYLKRLKYTDLPEMEGMSAKILSKIDTIAMRAIFSKAMPGCQIMVVRNGNVIYDKNFGYLAYDKFEKVSTETIYDVASVTKVSSTLQAVMRLYDEGRLDITQTASFYLPELKGTNKENMIIQEILIHQAGLPAFLEYWKHTLDSTRKPSAVYYSHMKDSLFRNQVSKDLYAKDDLRDSLWKWTIACAMPHHKEDCPPYRYSDVGFIIMNHIVERITGMPQDVFMQSYLNGLGMYNSGFNPLRRFPEARIAPTEVDNYFRHATIRGTVHDQGASMFGGVSGHAGLFSTANDLAKLYQMNLQDGEYCGKKILYRRCCS